MPKLHLAQAPKSQVIIDNPWRSLQQFTAARIGLGRVGNSIPTNELLAFQLAHAQAKDAVHTPLDVNRLADELSELQTVLLPDIEADVQLVHSSAQDRMVYLQRPDLGRQLDHASYQTLADEFEYHPHQYDVAIVVADGLSSRAVQDHAAPLIKALIAQLQSDASNDWSIAPLTLVQQGRVAVGDDIGELLHAKTVLVLIGERPGLSSPDSLGMYLTWAPKRGLDDASRNCISNVRPQGLSYEEASRRAFYLLTESRRLKLSGVNLKDRSETEAITEQQESDDFLLQ